MARRIADDTDAIRKALWRLQNPGAPESMAPAALEGDPVIVPVAQASSGGWPPSPPWVSGAPTLPPPPIPGKTKIGVMLDDDIAQIMERKLYDTHRKHALAHAAHPRRWPPYELLPKYRHELYKLMVEALVSTGFLRN